MVMQSAVEETANLQLTSRNCMQQEVVKCTFDSIMWSSIRTRPGPGSGPLWSHIYIAKVWSQSIFLTSLVPCTAFAQDM